MSEGQTELAAAGQAASGLRCPACGGRIVLEGPAAVRAMDRIAEDLDLHELAEWCTEWLLAWADDETLADFFLCAMAQRKDLEVVMEERREGEEEWLEDYM